MARLSAASIVKRMRGPLGALGVHHSPEAARVLIVDDEPSVCEFVEVVLSRAGYSTVVASSGVAALERINKQGPFDLLITDLMMPQMHGDELARQARRIEPNMKVLYLTGYSDRLFSEKATLWEDEAYLDKPTTIDSLLEAVSLLLQGRLMHRV